MRMFWGILAGAVAMTSSFDAAGAAGKRPFGVDDMLAMARLAEPDVSPDGSLVVYTVKTASVGDNKFDTDLWLARTDGTGTPRRLTAHPASDSGARFSGDGRSVYFLSARSGTRQVWRIGLDGGEAEQVTRLPVDVDLVVPIGTGERLLLALEVYPEARTLEQTARRDEERRSGKSKAMVYDRLLFRHWDSWEDGKRSHLFLWQDGVAPVDLLAGMDMDAPTRPFGGAEEIAVSPDGKAVVFAAKDEGRSAAWSTNVDLWLVSLGGRSRPVRLTAGNKAYDSRPAFSRDGKQLAYVAMARPGYESDRTRLFVMDWASRKSRALTEAWDRSVDELAWSHDGRSIYVTADHVGNRALFAVDASDGVVTVLEGKGHCADVRALPDGVLYSHDTFSTPAELFARRQAVQRITEHNTARVAALAWGQFEQFQFKGAHGDTVHGYLVRPPGHRGEKVPVAVLVHGGPQGSFDNHFHYRWNAQAFAGRGYATVIIDFHGSTGYGQAFTDAIRGDWGGAPFQDIMLGLDHLLARHKFLDGNRMAALGGSYGGYMINWINGNTQRFKALVAHASNIDETMAYYQTEELWFPEWERQGTPWDNPQAYAKHNPLSLVHRWRTPTLVIHGARDYRVVDTQGMAVFTALQRRGIPSRLLYFPEENHWILAPQNVQLWYREVLGWLDRHVRGTARAAVHRS